MTRRLPRVRRPWRLLVPLLAAAAILVAIGAVLEDVVILGVGVVVALFSLALARYARELS